MTTVSMHEAKTHLSRLVCQAEAGEDIIITRDKVPVARLVPIQPAPIQREPGRLRGKIILDAGFFEPLSDDDLKAWNGE